LATTPIISSGEDNVTRLESASNGPALPLYLCSYSENRLALPAV
jgi:hypothetical protein